MVSILKRVVIIPPSIDVFSPKNQQLTQPQVEGILAATKLVRGRPDDARFVRLDGSISHVARETDLAGGEPVPAGVPIVTQISRWDRLKDPLGLVKGFAELVSAATRRLTWSSQGRRWAPCRMIQRAPVS